MINNEEFNEGFEHELDQETRPTPIPPPEDLQGKSYSWILLNHREAIFEKIVDGQELNAMIRFFLLYTILFVACFGATLGFFALNLQILITMLKAPILVVGTMAICLPALFTFNVLLGSRLSLKQTTAVLSMASYILGLVLVSLAPIMLFFIVSTTSEYFIVLLTVLAFSIAGIFGVRMLWICMNYITVRAGYSPNRQIVQIWTLIYIFVGTQLAWILRPFISPAGSADELVLFRPLEGNFYQSVANLIIRLLTGD